MKEATCAKNIGLFVSFAGEGAAHARQPQREQRALRAQRKTGDWVETAGDAARGRGFRLSGPGIPFQALRSLRSSAPSAVNGQPPPITHAHPQQSP